MSGHLAQRTTTAKRKEEREVLGQEGGRVNWYFYTTDHTRCQGPGQLYAEIAFLYGKARQTAALVSTYFWTQTGMWEHVCDSSLHLYLFPALHLVYFFKLNGELIEDLIN